MLRLQCLLRNRVFTIEVAPDERIGELQARLEEDQDVMKCQENPDTVMKLYHVQQQRLTYRQDPTTKFEVLFLDGVEISWLEAVSSAVRQSATKLVPWALVSWYFQDQQFTFPDAVDIVVVWEDAEAEREKT